MRKISAVLSVVLVVIFIAASCNKNQKVVRQLDGEWEVTEVRYNNSVQDLEDGSYIYTFEKCRVKNEDCSGSYKISDPSKGTFTFPFTYSIQDDGTKIIINMSFMGETNTSEGEILEHSKNKFVWATTEEEEDMDGNTMEVKMVTTIEKK